MRYAVRRIVYPEGDEREIEWSLAFGELVDVAGKPLPLPVPTARMLAYRVYKVGTAETLNEEVTSYFLEQLFPDDLAAYAERYE